MTELNTQDCAVFLYIRVENNQVKNASSLSSVIGRQWKNLTENERYTVIKVLRISIPQN